MGWIYIDFLVTPEELAQIMRPFEAFIGLGFVESGYICTPKEEYLFSYKSLYEQLCVGEGIDFRARIENDIQDVFFITTNTSSLIWKHSEDGSSKTFTGSSRGDAPKIMPFPLKVTNEGGKLIVDTSGTHYVNNGSIMGLRLSYPKLTKLQAAKLGVESEKEWQSYDDLMLFKDRLAEFTKPLVIEADGVRKKMAVLVSDRAKEDLSGFSCIKVNQVTII